MTDLENNPIPATTLHVHRAVKGDLDSLAWLISRLSPLLLAQAEYRLGATLRTRVEPEDLVQEAWAVALPKLTELGGRGGRLTPKLLKFLSTAMTFKINNLLRANIAASVGSVVEAPKLPAEQSGVVTRAIRMEARETIRSCLEELDKTDRETVLLRGIEQHPAKTVAVMLGITPAAVDKRYSRALQRLRQRLPKSVFDEFDDE